MQHLGGRQKIATLRIATAAYGTLLPLTSRNRIQSDQTLLQHFLGTLLALATTNSADLVTDSAAMVLVACTGCRLPETEL